MNKVIVISKNSDCIYRHGKFYIPIDSKECWRTFITCKKLHGIICPNKEGAFPVGCPLEDAHE